MYCIETRLTYCPLAEVRKKFVPFAGNNTPVDLRPLRRPGRTAAAILDHIRRQCGKGIRAHEGLRQGPVCQRHRSSELAWIAHAAGRMR